MPQQLLITANMEVSDAYGQHLGKVVGVEGRRMKLVRADKGKATSAFIALEHVEFVDSNRIYLKQGTPLPVGAGTQR